MVYIHLSRSFLLFQLLGECHCWWTCESPMAHVAKFYDWLRLIGSVFRASTFSALRIIMSSDLENIFDRHFMPFSHFDIYIQNSVYILVEVSFKISTTWRVSLLADQRVPRAHAAKFYGWLRLIRSVFRASKFFVFKLIETVSCGFITPSLLASTCFCTFWTSFINFYTTFKLFG